MNTSAIEFQEARAQEVQIADDSLVVQLVDARTLTVPLAWYPRLWYGSPRERLNFELLDDGRLIHWPELDEDLSIVGMLAGRRSGERPESLKKWLAAREQSSRQ
jgi:hypothetical protein